MCILHNIASFFHCHTCWMEFKIPLPGLLKGNTGSQTLDYGLLPECFRKTLGKITNGAMQTFSHIMCISCVRPVMFAGLLLEQSQTWVVLQALFSLLPLFQVIILLLLIAFI